MHAMHPRVPYHLSSIRNAASVEASALRFWSLGRYWSKDRRRDSCNRSLMMIASDLTSVSVLDPQTAASISNRRLLIERGVALMEKCRYRDSNYDFYRCREREGEVDDYMVFWTVKDYFPTLARETRRLLRRGRRAAMEAERRRTPYNPFSEEACRRIERACRARSARSLTLYGSYADGTQGLHSEIDFLAEMDPRLHPDRRIGSRVKLRFDLERILGGRVDVTSPSWIWNSYKKDSIRHCSVLLYSREDPTFRGGWGAKLPRF